MKMVLFLLGSIVLLVVLCGCSNLKPTDKISSICAPSSYTQIFTDEASGTVTQIVRYSFEAPTRRNDGIIELCGKYSSDDESGSIVIFYSAAGTVIGKREYPAEGNSTDYLYLAELTKDGLLRGYDVERQDGSTVYLKDGSYMVIEESDGIVTGHDIYDSDGTLALHYRGNKYGMSEELWLAYSHVINDYTLKVGYSYIDIALS